MRLLIFISMLLAGCSTAKTDPYESVCGPARGYFFAEGENIPLGIEQDYLENVPLEALECRAAEGDYYAQYNLGRLYLEGKRVELYFQKAADLFLAAGEPARVEQKSIQPGIGGAGFLRDNRTTQETLGFAPAQYALGLMYYSGLIGKKDLDQAIFWMKKAAILGNLEAKDFLVKIEGGK